VTVGGPSGAMAELGYPALLDRLVGRLLAQRGDAPEWHSKARDRAHSTLLGLAEVRDGGLHRAHCRSLPCDLVR
jgi:hypothetical protein